MDNNRKKGTIKLLFPDKGYGFLVPLDSRCQFDVFFHVTRYRGDTPFEELQKGQVLEYNYEVRDNGKIRATQIYESDKN